MAAEEWRSVALVGDTATAAERDMSQKAHCIDAGLRHQIGRARRGNVCVASCVSASREWRSSSDRKACRREASQDRERHFKVHDGKPDAWRLCGCCAGWRIGVVSGLRHGRSGELRSCDIQHAVPPWLDLETAHGNCRHGAVGTRQAGSGFTGAEVLPGIPAEAVACHHTATLGKPWRDPLLQRA